MLPYLKEGDIVFFKKYKKNKSILKNRQIVIFNHPIKNKNLIKRINSVNQNNVEVIGCLLYTSPSPRDATLSRMPSSA